MDPQESQDDSDWEFEDSEHEELFTKATQVVQRTHDKILPNDLLELYGLYKQATVGKCNTPKPGIFSMQARAKWCAWNDLLDTPKDVAMQMYIDKVRDLDPVWYENVLKGIKSTAKGTSWVVHSTEMPPESCQLKSDHEKNIFDFVKDKNIQRIKETLQKADFQLLDEHGMGIIHWASDANDIEILELLLLSGCPVDLCDAEQQTALHYASSCGHVECAKLLLQFGADKMKKDSEGQTCLDVADDSKIRSLFES